MAKYNGTKTPRNIYKEVSDRIVAAMEKGVVPWHQPWSNTSRSRYVRGMQDVSPFHNAKTGSPYRGLNIWLLSLASIGRWSDTRFCTYKQATDMGGTVRKGEKGTMVILWKPMHTTVKDNNNQDVSRSWMMLRSFTVFNVEQCDNLKIPTRRTKTVEAIDEDDGTEDVTITGFDTAQGILDAYVERENIKINHGSNHACFYPGLDIIELPSPKQFKESAEYFSTAFHEITHSTLMPDRCDRKGEFEAGVHKFGSYNYGQEELVAEFGSAFLCSVAGIDSTVENSAAYLSGWLKAIKEDEKLLISAAGRAQKATDYILDIKPNYQKNDDDKETSEDAE